MRAALLALLLAGCTSTEVAEPEPGLMTRGDSISALIEVMHSMTIDLRYARDLMGAIEDWYVAQREAAARLEY